MIVLDYQDRRPLYEQVAEKLQRMIEKGVLAKDEQLPSVRSLAMELSINPNTIQRAYGLLEQEGYIYPVKGRGNFVSPPESFIGERKAGFFRELDELLLQGYDMGISRIEICEHVDGVYKEGNR
ncbi:MAG: GntR family transcriptional regulator [Ruminococcus sp.]|jgi:GntR family transcriptional regulator